MDLSIILPIYNERENIRPLFSELHNALGLLGKTYEIIAIDDGSQDGSQEILEDLAKENLQKKDCALRVVCFRKNAGQSAAFDAGFRHASGKIIITMDSDLQNDPKDVVRLLEKIEAGYDFVTGWRKNRQDAFLFRTLPSRIANQIIRWITKTPIHDLGCSLKAFRKEVTDDLRLYGEMHRFIAVLVENQGAKIAELEVNHRARNLGESKYGLSRTFKVLLDLLTVWFMKGYQTKPIYVFGGTGVALLFLSAASSGYVLYEKYFAGVWVHKNPLFILSMMFALIGVQFLGLGLIAEIIIRTYYESQRKPAYFISKTIGFNS